MEEDLSINACCMQLQPADLVKAGLLFFLYAAVIIIFFRLFPFDTAESAIYQSNLSGKTATKISQKVMLVVAPESKLMLDVSLDVDAIIGASEKIEFPVFLSSNQAGIQTESPRFNFPTFRGKKGEKAFHPIIQKFSQEHDLDPAWIKAIIMAESSYNPEAVSKKGARGLMQLMPGTAESLGVEDCFNPEQNISGGVRYFKKLFNKFDGDIILALAAYNAGITHVRKHNGVPPFKATRYYVQKVFHYYNYYKKQPSKSLAKADV